MKLVNTICYGTEDGIMNEYPECFPDDFEENILPKEATQKNRKVYRIMKSGVVERDNFISSAEEIALGLIPRRKNWNERDPELYSTSCYENKEDAEHMLKVFMRRKPQAIIAGGITEQSCGPSQPTAERKKTCEDSHVDWWIYKAAEPHKHFKEVGEDDGKTVF